MTVKKKDIDLDKYQNELLFVSLGGCNEIGINMYLFCYMGKILIVDFGSGFFNKPGVEIGFPKIDFLIENQHRILGLFITHAHEDHIGAIQYLWKFIKCTIYTTQFTSNFIKNKLQENNTSVNIKVLDDNKKYSFKPFDVELVALTHSCPEMYALAIYGPHGILFHSGDWKYDPDPIINHKYDKEKLVRMGKEGVHALFCDSTNTFQEEHSRSEGELQEALLKMISEMKNMVVVTTFASNLARLQTLITIARKLKKRIFFAGRSMFRMILSANQSGYKMNCEDIIVEDKDVDTIPRDKLLVVCTGCQGEPSAALTRILQNRGMIKIKANDNVIFSSKNIPGNEKRIFEILDILVRKKINIRTSLDYFVHVSGHPSIKELKGMYDDLKPNCVVPVHGETYHVFKQAQLAKSFGVPHSIAINNGDVLMLRPNEYKVIDTVTHGINVMDGKILVDIQSKLFYYRELLGEGGVFSVSVSHENFKNLKDINIVSYGVVSLDTHANIISYAKVKLSEELKQLFNNGAIKSKDDLEDKSKLILKNYFVSRVGKHPIIIIHVNNV